MHFTSLIILFFYIFLPTLTEAAIKHGKIRPKPYVPKYSAIVMNADTGKILEEEDSHGTRHPASLTKMMTLYMTFEALHSGHLTLQTKMTTSSKAARQAPSKFGLVPGEEITVYQAIMGLITKSANDAAVVLAEHLAVSEESFARQMSQKASRLGMTKTVFKNASGLPNPAQVTSAHDMAILARALYRDFPQEYKYFKNHSFEHKGAIYQNHNRLLGKVEGVDGIKTGFINTSGFNLAASAIRYDALQKPCRLIAIVLGGPNRHWRDKRVTELLEGNFQKVGLGGSQISKEPHHQLLKLNPLDVKSRIKRKEKDINQSPPVVLNQLLETVMTKEKTSGSKNSRLDPAPSKTLAVSGKKEHSLFTVQVGIYRNQQTANQCADRAKALLQAGQARTVTIQKGKKKLRAAQVTALTQVQARSLCKKLQKKGQQCVRVN